MNPCKPRVAGRAMTVVAFAALAACAGLSDPGNESMLNDGAVQFPAILHRASLRVTAIDGRSNTFPTPIVSPGRHDVRFAAPPVGTLTQTVEKVYTLDIQPCTRYYPVAQRDSAFEQDWHLVIERIEPIGGRCTTAVQPRRAAEPQGVETTPPTVVGAGRPYS